MCPGGGGGVWGAARDQPELRHGRAGSSAAWGRGVRRHCSSPCCSLTVGEWNLPGASRLVIAPGASVQIFVGGTAISMAGNAVLNPNGTASQLSLFGLPSMTSLTFSGNSQFTGAIYAPSADLKFNGGGNNRLDCMGAAVVKSITLNGHFSVHYDEALQTFGSQLTYKIASWREL